MENTVDIDSIDFTPVDTIPEVESQPEVVNASEEDFTSALSEVYKMYAGTNDDKLIYDSKETTISQLPKEDQLEVLLQLMKNKPTVVQETPQLEEQEIEFLNQLREAGVSIEDYIESLTSYQPAFTFDISEMSNEQVIEYDIRKTLAETGQEVTDEDIIDQVQALKSAKNFTKIAESIKTKLLQEEENQMQYNTQLEEQEMNNQYQEISSKIIDNSINIGNISGFDIDNQDRNVTIQSLIELDNDGLTWFDKEVLAKPDNLVRASWLIRNEGNINKYISELETKLNDFESGIQDKINEAYNKGQQDIIKNKFPSNIVTSQFISPQKTAETPSFSSGGLNPSVSFDPRKMRNVDEL